MPSRSDLLFLGLVAVVALVVANQLFPTRPVPVTRHENSLYHDPDFTAAVERVDVSFRSQWSAEKLNPAPVAPDLAIARRLALGLMGTIPSLEEIRQIEGLPVDQRLDWYLDHILADRRFDDYLAERFARAFVGTEGGPFVFFRRRRFVNWLADEMAVNRPYDQIVRELIASEGLWTSQPASNFVSVTAQQDNHNQPDPVRLAGRVTRAFLGLRLDCAQCHDHPFADWKQSDFEGLSAYFGQTHLGFTGIHNGKGEYEPLDRKTQKTHVVKPRVPFNTEMVPESGPRREQLARWVTDPRNPYFARAAVNRVWALLLGRPLVEPVDNLEAGTAPPVLQLLADDFSAHHFDLRRLIRVIAHTQVFRLDSAAPHEIRDEEENGWAVFPLTRLRPEQVAGGVLQTASVKTIDSDSHILVRLARYGQQNEFLQRYGDSGEDEFSGRGGTIPQRLLLMNGHLLQEHIRDAPFNASTQIGVMSRDTQHAIETTYLAVLTRRPTEPEVRHFEKVLAGTKLRRAQQMEDIYWALLNATEFSWNH
jgi:hypothetical protein